MIAPSHAHGCHGHACVAMPRRHFGGPHAHDKRGHGTRGRAFSTGKWRRSTRGLTLLEILLATSLAVVVLAIVSAAIDFHLRVLGSGREDVEQAQLARAILQNIATDLHNAVPYAPMDAGSMLPSGLTAGLTAGASGSGTDAAAAAAAAMAAGDSGGGDSATSGSQISQRSSDDTSLVTDTTVGLYGTKNWLQVDTSRLPRLDQVAQPTLQVEGSTVLDRPSEVKTVAYFVAPARGDGQPGGLVRRELDRAVTSWATQQGLIADVEEQLRPIAPEVTAIEFAYYDGTEIWDYWDMDERNALPMAVEVVLHVAPSQLAESDEPGGSGRAEAIVYRLWVHLPTGQPSTLDDAEEEKSTEEDSTSQQSSSQKSTSQPTGGQPTGGQPTGGQPTGGQPTGGQPTGGQPTGGRPTSGQPTGGQPTGGQNPDEEQPKS